MNQNLYFNLLITCLCISNLNAITFNDSLVDREQSDDSSVDSQKNTNRALMQQILHRIGILENDSQRETDILKEIIRIVSRVEVQRQDIVLNIDRSEARIFQRLDDIKGDLRKVITLQEVLRDDLNKLEQEQDSNKVWFSEQFRNIGKRNANPSNIDVKPSLIIADPDIGANLQIVQTTLLSLKRSIIQLDDQVFQLTSNVSDLAVQTHTMVNRSLNNVDHKQFNKGMRNILDEMKKSDKQNVVINSQAFSEINSKISVLPNDCKQVQELEKLPNISGIYRIKPIGLVEPIFVYCDQVTDGGGWTLIQKRQDGTIDFFRDWFDYKYGFGNVAAEHWIGNDNIHLITYQNIYEIRIDLEDFEGDKAYAKYNAFAIGSEKENYMIKMLGSYEGDAGDSMSYHVSLPFSTKDNDNDGWSDASCAVMHTGGWWYGQCEAANLNGQYLAGLSPQEYKGIYWAEWQGPSYSLKKVEIKIRPYVLNAE